MLSRPPVGTSGRSPAPVLALCSHLHGRTGILDLLRSWEGQEETPTIPSEAPVSTTYLPAAPTDSPARTTSQSTVWWYARSMLEEHVSGRWSGLSKDKINTQVEKSERTADATARPPCVSTRTASPEHNEGATHHHAIVGSGCGVGSVQEDGCDDEEEEGGSSFKNDGFLEAPAVGTCGTRRTPASASPEVAPIAPTQGAGSQPMTVPGRKTLASTQGRCDVGLLGNHAGTKSAADAHLGAEPCDSMRRLTRGRTTLSYCEEEWDEYEPHPRRRVADHAQTVGPRSSCLVKPLLADPLLATGHSCCEEPGQSKRPELQGAVLGREHYTGEHRRNLCHHSGSKREARRSASISVASTVAPNNAAVTEPMRVPGGHAQGQKRKRLGMDQTAGMTLIRFQ